MAKKHQNQTSAHIGNGQCASDSPGAAQHPIYQQCLRVLRCTAKAMVSSPGGLRFKAGTRPWLEGLESIARGGATPALSTFGDAA